MNLKDFQKEETMRKIGISDFSTKLFLEKVQK